VLQEFKQHPFVAKLLEGGKMIRYGAKSMPYGGWWAIPPVAGNGWMILGDSAGFLNSARLKGIHLAIKSGMLAAETAFEALKKDDSSAAMLGEYQKKVESSWIKDELWKVRNMHQGFEHGFYAGMFHTGLQMITGGRGLRNRYLAKAGYEHMRKLADLPADGGAEAHLLGPAKGDGKLTFDTSSPTSTTPGPSTKKTSLAPGDSRYQHLQHALRERIRQPLPEFLSGERLRDGRRCEPARMASASA
jgi:electron-transferring-flavoprotein dehydrogenase